MTYEDAEKAAVQLGAWRYEERQKMIGWVCVATVPVQTIPPPPPNVMTYESPEPGMVELHAVQPLLGSLDGARADLVKQLSAYTHKELEADEPG